MSSPEKFNSLNAYIQKVTEKANKRLEDKSRAIHIPAAVVAALITSGTTIGMGGAAYALAPTNSDGAAKHRTMRLQIKSQYWGLLRLVVGTLETTFVIPPDLDLDGQFSVVLYNENEERASRIYAEYTGFPFSSDQDKDPVEKAANITLLYEFATKVDAYVQVDHTKPLPTVLMSADRNNIDDWGNG